MTTVNIRAERPEDRDAVHRINTAAFPTSVEADLVDRLRIGAHPCISLVAEDEGEIAGHILFTPVTVSDLQTESLVMGLAPMAVAPDCQRQGIGSDLVRAGLERCRELNASAVVVLGHEEYYPRFGFEPASQHGLVYKTDQYDPYFFVLELAGGALEKLRGSVDYHPEFDKIAE